MAENGFENVFIQSDVEKKLPRILIAAVDTNEYDVERSIAELKELISTAGGKSVCEVVQKRQTPDSVTAIGSGRLNEMKQLVKDFEADAVVFDMELTATQIRNIEDALDIETIDRTMLILDIFAQRATTKEGKLQVEIAKYKYLLPRLSGMGKELSRTGGAVGMRGGPGETKLELDRRHIRSRIGSLERELKEISVRRDLLRKRRKKDGILTAAIVGYTNVGKSTLMNALTEAGVLCENKLFATLETTSRSIILPDGRSVLLTDTVGLISRLPHHLIEAFKSTLEEAANADVILHVCDSSSEDLELKTKVALELLSELGCDGIPVVTVLNKSDVSGWSEQMLPPNTVLISAKEGRGLDKLLEALQNALPKTAQRMRLSLPFSEAGLLSKIRADGKVISEEYSSDGILVEALVDHKLVNAVKEYETK